ncbi:MAG: hypothetical protein PHY93_01445 [Bacteriovorax sp.]|nr:hypothetical protein [Bacteriovorax sp.]
MKLKSIAGGLLLATAISTSLVNAKVISDFDETKIQAPFTDSNNEGLQTTVCRTRDHLKWDYCSTIYENGEEQMKSFKFSNDGENKIVPKSGFGVGRDFEFMFEGFASSDLGLLIWDMPDETESHGHLKLMMFFPRLVMPAIRYISDSEKDIVIVTLPTKEEMIFNGKSKEVVSGVIIEAPIKQDKAGNALTPSLTYTGSGVVVEADRLADYPVGLASQKNNSATIRKKGYKDCKIPVKDLWYTDDNKGGNVFFNKKYVTDKAFDQFLKQKCKFSMY